MARARGQIWPAFGNTDKPSPGPKPLPRVKWTDDRYRDEDTGSDREFGEPPDTAVLWGSSPHAARASCPRGRCPKIQETGQPSPALHSLPRGPGAPPAEVLVKRKETLVEKGRLAAACPPREGPPALAFSPSYPSRVQPWRA